MTDQIDKILDGLPPDKLAEFMNAAKVAKAQQVLADAGLPQPSMVPTTPFAPATKPGWKTTEFWLPIIMAALAALLDRIGLRDVAQLIGGGSAAAALTYPISAGMRKAKAQ